jgi:hypothetical protein
MAWAARGIGAFALAVVLVTLSTVFVALRFVSRGRILRIFGPTDWFMLVTLVGAAKDSHRVIKSPILTWRQVFALASAANVGACKFALRLLSLGTKR